MAISTLIMCALIMSVSSCCFRKNRKVQEILILPVIEDPVKPLEEAPTFEMNHSCASVASKCEETPLKISVEV